MGKTSYPATAPVPFLRPTWVEISLSAFRHNFNQVKKRLKKGTAILSVVKADAYGHGMKEIARASISCGAKLLGVANIEEGILLRESGINAGILIMGSIYPFSNFSYVLEYDLTPTICSLEALQELFRTAKRVKKNANFHIKVDTGMGRIGVSPGNALSLIREATSLPGISLQGIYTHLAAADSDREFTLEQIEKFNCIVKQANKEGIKITYAHCANSTAIFRYPEAHFNMVRPGICLFGLVPFKGAEKEVELKPVLQLKTKVVFVKKVRKGTSISYGRTWKAKKDSIIGTIPIGYADGYNRLLSNCGQVLIRGRRVPIVGRVCMDMCMVDLTSFPDINVGEEVVLIGSQGKEKITVEEIAQRINTISYEVVCGISKRVPRIYI